MHLLEKRKKRLNERLNGLQSKLGRTLTDGNEREIDEIVKDIKAAETELKEIELTNKVEAINKREAERRAIIKKVIAVGLFSSDLLTNDLKLNKSKKKQNPELYKLADEQPYMYFKIGYDSIISIYVNGHEYRTGKKEYSSGQTSEILPFESFEDACNFNNIQLKNITVKQVQTQIDNIKKAEEVLKIASEKCDEIKKANNSYFLTSEGFFNQQNANIHTLHTEF